MLAILLFAMRSDIREAVFMDSESQPLTWKPRRLKRIACKACGHEDLWRVHSHRGLITWFFGLRGKKRFACRYCGNISYQFARRVDDRDPEFLG